MFNAFLEEYQRHNIFHSALLLTGMVSLLAVIGYLFAGVAGIVLAIVLGVFAFVFTPRLSPDFILRMYQAQILHPHAAPELYTMLNSLVEKSGLKNTPILYYVPSQIMNSFTVGSKDQYRILLSDALLRHLNARELYGVLAHELSHVQNNDLQVMTLADVITRITSILSLFGVSLLILYLPMFILEGQSFPWTIALLLLFTPNLSALLQLALSRTREFFADEKAVELTGDPAGLASALGKIEYLSEGWLKRFLLPQYRVNEPSVLRTHPPSKERIERLKKLAVRQQRIHPEDISLLPEYFKARQTVKPKKGLHGFWY